VPKPRAGRAAPAPELSRPVTVARVDAKPILLDIAAGEDELAALAARFGLLALQSLSARAELCRAQARDGSGPAVRVTFDWQAAIVQACVVTLEPVPATLGEQGVEIEFALDGGERERRRELSFSLDDPEPPEPPPGPVIDIGEIVAEQLGLAVDPYPRKPDAAFEWAESSGADRAAGRGPFAALGRRRSGGLEEASD